MAYRQYFHHAVSGDGRGYPIRQQAEGNRQRERQFFGQQNDPGTYNFDLYGPVTNGAGTVIGSLGTSCKRTCRSSLRPWRSRHHDLKANLGTIWGRPTILSLAT